MKDKPLYRVVWKDKDDKRQTFYVETLSKRNATRLAKMNGGKVQRAKWEDVK